MSGIVGSKLNIRGSGRVAKLGTDGQVLTSSGAGVSAVYEDGATTYDDNKLQSNIALLGFKTAVNGSLAKYNLQDQIIDEYEDTSGVDASASTNEALSSGAYFGGSTPVISHDADATDTDGDYTWYKWTATGAGSYETDTTQDHEYLVVAGGGGGGGCDHGGGGGAGGFRTATGFSLIGGTTYTTTVGAGGAGAGNDPSLGSSGSDSSLSGSDITDVTSAGGGGGGGNKVAAERHGADGGSGGGGAGYGGIGSPNGLGGSGDTPDTTPDQGNDGGDGNYPHGSPYPTGGGGGAGAVGGSGSGATPGNGGAGTASSITGSSVTYAGGGGGSSTGGAQGSGGSGGGGAGAHGAATDGTANTGGGGGGSSGDSGGGGDGGSGIVILRRLTLASGSDLTLQSTDTTAMTEPDYADMVILMENAEGTATINTDIKGYISEDSGSTFTQGTLVDEGTWGTNKKVLAFHDLDISAQSGTSMCYKITTHNQSTGSKETKIHATSIGWKA